MDNNRYDADSIQLLVGLTPVRVRPGMFVGDTGIGGLHHLVKEIVANSTDERMAGHCTKIRVEIAKNGSTVTVEDDGRGIPVAMHAIEKKPCLEVVLGSLHAGGKFDETGYKVSGGLHGVGASCVNALSTPFRAVVKRDGGVYEVEYSRGDLVSPSTRVRDMKKREGTGTLITFTPDSEIFKSGITFEDKILISYLRECAFLCRGLRIDYINRSTNVSETFEFSGGVADYVSYLTANKNHLYPKEPIFFEGVEGRVSVEVALQYSQEDGNCTLSFANNVNTMDGGTHLSGFRSGLTRVVNGFYNDSGLKKVKDSNLAGDDIRDGLTVIISVSIPQPEFVSQTKNKLGSVEAEGAVSSVVLAELTKFFEKNPAIIKTIVNRALLSRKAREAAKKQMDLIKRKGVFGGGGGMPDKLWDCRSKDPRKSELFLVEGASAAGCFSGDVKVSLTDGRELSFMELIAEDKAAKQNYCYTVLADGKVGVGKILSPRWTKRANEWIKITLDNGETITCTLDHKFMLVDGSYREASNLQERDSLRPLYRRLSDDDRTLALEAILNHNHKIKRVEICHGEMDFYDLEVEGTHNFALTAGVFVHNSSKGGRNPETMAILPLRGKVINAEKHPFASLIKNTEIQSMIKASGVGINEDFNLEGLRYHKIIIMADADDDGCHIAALLMTFFFRYMKPLITHGHLYLAVPPLYKVTHGKTKHYAWDEKELADITGGIKGKTHIVRFKGLGEMDDEELGWTTMNPENRRLIRLNISDMGHAERMLTTLMGSSAEARKIHIKESINSIIAQPTSLAV